MRAGSIWCNGLVSALAIVALIGCRAMPPESAAESAASAAMEHWTHCAVSAYRALGAAEAAVAAEAAALATRCTDAFLKLALRPSSRRWSQGPMRLGDTELTVELRGLSPYLEGPLALARAQDVPVDLFGGERHASPGFGVPLVVVTPRCQDRPLCQLLPPEGVFRWATAWIEAEPEDNPSAPRLVIADPLAAGPLVVGDRRYPLALDTSAFYARGVSTSKLRQLALWGLLGDDQVGRRAGLYLLEDYDPNKRPVVMIHGLGSSPLAWARLSNALWGSPDLRARFQIWHLVYQTNAPLLVTRRRLQGYLDAAWQVLEPEGDDPARAGMVLIGHSLGGVLSRMLCVASGEVLWWAAFTVPPETLRGDPADLEAVESTFRFQPYPGVSRAIFIAAPHRGSPTADRWVGRLFRTLVGRRVPEMQSLGRIASENPEAVREELRATYQQADLNSIATLQTSQPVRRAGETLLPAAGIPYHTIAGVLPGRQPATDGVVPLASALLPSATSTLVVESGHNVHQSAAAVAKVLRILRADLARAGWLGRFGWGGSGGGRGEKLAHGAD